MRCPGCRELAEALRPTPDFGPESVTDEESWELPVYWSQQADLAPQAVSSGVAATAQAVVRRMVRRARPRRPVVDRVGLRLAGAVVLGVLFGFLWQAMDSELQEVPGSWRGSASAEIRFKRQAKRGSVEVSVLQQIGLADDCYKPMPASSQQQNALAASPLKHVRYAEVACCTDCHHRYGEAKHVPATASIVQRCAACHQEDR